MERTIQLDGKEVRLRASAAIPRLYRIKFGRDIIQDMAVIQKAIQRAAGQSADVSESDTSADKSSTEVEGSSLPLEALTLFENVAYLMAKHADPEGVPPDVGEWLDGFEPFSIYSIFPVVLEMWNENLRTLNISKKKYPPRRGR